MRTSDHWQCPISNGLLRKGMGSAGWLFGAIFGTGTCAMRSAEYQQSEIYDGKWGVEVVSLVGGVPTSRGH